MKKNIAVLCGGYSREREVSLRSAEYVLDNLNPEKYNAFKVIVSPEKWFCEIEKDEYEIDKNYFGFEKDGLKIAFDAVYVIIHGDPGENGKIQAYLEMMNIPFTTCDSTVSALTFNKAYCNYAVKSLDVNIAPSVHLVKGDAIDVEKILDAVGLPCFVKPNSGGSSIGMSKVTKSDEILDAIERAFHEDEEVLVEAFFEGREVTCGLLKVDGKMIVLPICEVVSKNDFFDFESKYDENLVDEIIPARITNEIAEVIKSTSVYLYNKLNMSGVVRMDYLFNEDSYIFLEVNTVPGMSAQSIVPQMARAHGWTNKQFLSYVLGEII